MSSRGRRPPRLRQPQVLRERSRELRHPLSPAERRLWAHLRDNALGIHARRQHVLLSRFIVDFYIARARLCIEIDGNTHAGGVEEAYDRRRTNVLKKRGYRVIRFSNREVIRNLEAVLEAIRKATAEGAATPTLPLGGGGLQLQ